MTTLATRPVSGWYFHGVANQEAFEKICRGEDILRLAPTVSDPGDLGRGLYLTSRRAEASNYGHGNVLRVHVQLQNALIVDFRPQARGRAAANAWLDHMNALYGSPVTGRRYEMLLAEEAWEAAGEIGPPPPYSRVIHADRVAAATAWRDHMLQSGVDGISARGWDFGGPLVLFLPERQVVEIECPTPRRRSSRRRG